MRTAERENEGREGGTRRRKVREGEGRRMRDRREGEGGGRREKEK
jgi:hypothetical protein